MNVEFQLEEHPPGSNSTGKNCSQNAARLVTKGMLCRSFFYLLFTYCCWRVCSIYSPEKQPFSGLSIWDIAFLACGFSGFVSLLMGEWGAMHKKYMSYWMLGMLLRGGTPVMVLLCGRDNQLDWESRGIFISFGVAYLLTLCAETVLSVYLLQERYPRYAPRKV